MWFVYTLAAGFFSCLYYFGNQLVKVAPNVFMFYRGAVPALLLLPWLPLMPAVAAWEFYAFCVLQGLVIAFIDYRNYRAMRAWGAETISALHPLGIGLVFVVWLLLKPATVGEYAENWWRFAGIVVALAGIIYATAAFKKSRRGYQALRYEVPYLFGAAACDVINKICMSYVTSAELIYASYFYILITGWVVAGVNFELYRRGGGNPADLGRRQNWPCVAVMLMLMLSMLCKNFAMFNVTNPAFVSATLYLYIIWIMLGSELLKRRSVGRGNYRHIARFKALILLASAVLLIFLE